MIYARVTIIIIMRRTKTPKTNSASGPLNILLFASIRKRLKRFRYPRGTNERGIITEEKTKNRRAYCSLCGDFLVYLYAVRPNDGAAGRIEITSPGIYT